MKAPYTARFAAAFLLGIGAGKPCAQEIVVMQHLGATDPVAEGWLLRSAGAPTLAPVMNDLGRDAWSISLNSRPDGALYSMGLNPQQEAQAASGGWVLSLTLRVLPPYNSQPSGGIAAELSLNSRYYLLLFDATTDGHPMIRIENSAEPLLTLDGAGAGYHNYQLRYETATQNASLWVDDTEQLSDVAWASGVSQVGLVWGGAQRPALLPTAYANWSEVTFTIVPEPSAATLLLGGIIMLGFRRLGRRRPQSRQ